MSDFRQTLAISASGMKVQGRRLRHVAENIANADTPGYRRKTVTFETTRAGPEAGTVRVGRLSLDRTQLKQVYDPAHPLANGEGFYDGSNVNTLIEVADSREAQRGYEANLRMFDQARQMTRGLLDLLRR